MRSRWQPFLTLVRAFLARFFDNEITAGAHDLKAALFGLIAILAMPGAIAPALLGMASLQTGVGPPDPSTWGWALIARYEGVEVLRIISRADKTLYLGFAMMVAGLLSAVTWSSLLVDRRDGLVLGVLPVRSVSVIGAKLLAIAAYVGLVSVAIHLLASISFGFFLAASNTVGFALRGMVAHFVASCAASAFVCLSVVAVQGLTLAVAGPRSFTRLSAILQAALIALVVLGLLTLPVVSASVVDTLKHSGPHARPWILLTPPLWFLGLYEWVLGTSDPVLRHLAATAGLATSAVLTTIAIAYPLACRRVLVNAVEHAGGFGRVGRSAAVGRLIASASGRRPEVRAVSQYFLSTIGRVGQHRFVLAIAIGAAAAWGLPSWMSLASSLPPAPRTDLLSLPITAMLFVLVGLRIAASLPSDIPAAWVFAGQAPAREDIRQALERTMFALGVVPATCVSVAVYWYLWGGRIALVHAGCVLATGAALTELILWRVDVMPCSAPWSPPTGHLRKWWPAYLFAFAAITQGVPPIPGLPAVEVLVLGSPQVAPLFIAYMWGVAAIIRKQARTPRPVGDGESAELLTSALRVGRGEGDLGEGRSADRKPVRPTDGRSIRPALALFESFRTPEGEERWFDGFSIWPGELVRDMRVGWRRLRHAPTFTLFSIVTLALGIGVATAAYSVIYDAIWRPLGIPHADRVLVVSQGNSYPTQAARMSWPDYADFRDQQGVFASLTAWGGVDTSLAGNGRAELVTGQAVDGNYFQVFGVQPALGRLIQPSDDRPDASPVVVLSQVTWRRQFGSDPEVVGKAVTLGNRVFDVVGVAPEAFRGSQPGRSLAIWVPLAAASQLNAWLGDLNAAAHPVRDVGWLMVAGRLRPELTSDAAAANVFTIGKALDAVSPLTPRAAGPPPAAPRPNPRYWRVMPLVDSANLAVGYQIGRLIVTLPVLVLLVACTNLANLVLSRGAARRHEFAVRRALGASRWTLVREVLVEVGAIAAIGGAGGLLVTRGLLAFLMTTVRERFGYKPGFLMDPHFEPAVFVAAAITVLLALIVAGLVPALQLTQGQSVRSALASDTPASGFPRWRGRGNLIALQVAVSVGLFLIAAVLYRQIGIEGRQPGPNLDRVAIATVPFTEQQRDPARIRQTVDGVLGELRATSGVDAAAASTMYQNRAATSVQVTTPERPFVPQRENGQSADFIIGTPGLFRTLRVPVQFGRTFDDRDVTGAPPVVVINDSLARAEFGTPEAAGRQLSMRFASVRLGFIDARTLPIETVTVVGVVPDRAPASAGRIPADVYAPLSQREAFDLAIFARASTSDVLALGNTIRAAIRRVDPELAVSFAGRADLAVGGSAAALGVVSTIAASLAGLALVLSMAGLYGVLAHVMARRMREMGVRVALGAERGQIMRLVFVDGLRPVVQGLVIGLGVAFEVRLLLQASLTTPLSPIDPVACLLAIAPLAVAALAACYLPARRASSVDPNTALRDL